MLNIKYMLCIFLIFQGANLRRKRFLGWDNENHEITVDNDQLNEGLEEINNGLNSLKDHFNDLKSQVGFLMIRTCMIFCIQNHKSMQ